MNNTVLQIPMSSDLRQKSEKAAENQGFSSLQEVVRVFLNKFANGDLTLNFEMPQIKLSPKAEKRYQKIIQDYENDRNITKTDNLNDFFDKLNK